MGQKDSCDCLANTSSLCSLLVLGKAATRAFSVIFARAQRILRNTFGYELVELRARGADNDQLLQQTNAAPAAGGEGDTVENTQSKSQATQRAKGKGKERNQDAEEEDEGIAKKKSECRVGQRPLVAQACDTLRFG